MGLTCHQDQFYLSERCHRYTLPLQRQSTKSSIGWYKKLPCKESQKEILPLEKSDTSAWYFNNPFCEGPELLPKLHWSAMQNNFPNIKAYAGNCQEVCCQTISTVVPYEIQAGDRWALTAKAFTPSLDRKIQLAAFSRRRRKETHWNWGGISWIKHRGIVSLYNRWLSTNS